MELVKQVSEYQEWLTTMKFGAAWTWIIALSISIASAFFCTVTNQENLLWIAAPSFIVCTVFFGMFIAFGIVKHTIDLYERRSHAFNTEEATAVVFVRHIQKHINDGIRDITPHYLINLKPTCPYCGLDIDHIYEKYRREECGGEESGG